MRKDYFSSFGGKTEKDVTCEWIFKSMKVIRKLNQEVEDYYKSWEWMDLEDIKRYLESLPSWEAESEKGYAFGNFHSCMVLHAGPLHHKLDWRSPNPVDKTEEEIRDEYGYVYGGGFDFLDEEDIKFLRANGYVVVDGPEGPECRLA